MRELIDAHLIIYESYGLIKEKTQLESPDALSGF